MTRHAWVPVLAIVAATGCGRREQYFLEVDYTTRDFWPHALTVEVSGSARLPESSLSFGDTLQAAVVGRSVAGEPHRLDFTVDSARVRSDELDRGEALLIENQLAKASASLSIRDGFVTVDTGATARALPPGTWDLYRHLVKVLPALPATPVRPGFAWERETWVPLVTNHGRATAQLYQSFTFDSVGTPGGGPECAFLSWRFSYAVTPGPSDTAGYIDNLPGKGTGTGKAVLDLAGKCLQSAEARLTVPPEASDPVGIAWNEYARLSLVQ